MNLDWRNEPATDEQKEKLCFFGCTWGEGISSGQASDALEECARLWPDREAAYRPIVTVEVPSPSQSGSPRGNIEVQLQEVTIQEPVKSQDENLQAYTIPARAVQDFAQRQPASAAKTVNDLLTNCSSSDGCYWLPVVKAANLCGIFNEAEEIAVGQSHLIAEKIGLAGFCVEPDARAGNGAYGWNETVGLFKPADGRSKKPSEAYLGAANLLRLCVLVAAADGRIDEVELDVARQVIESQLDFSETDHQRLLVLERLLTQDPSSAAKTLAKVAKSVPVHKRLLVGKVLVRVAAADGIITNDERRALERIFKALDIPPGTLEGSIGPGEPPSLEVRIQEARTGPNSERISENVPPLSDCARSYSDPATPEQFNELRAHGINVGPGLRHGEANELIESCRRLTSPSSEQIAKPEASGPVPAPCGKTHHDDKTGKLLRCARGTGHRGWCNDFAHGESWPPGTSEQSNKRTNEWDEWIALHQRVNERRTQSRSTPLPEVTTYPTDVGAKGERSVYETRRIGHSNAGHDFGTGLSAGDKLDLIEFLKTL